MPQFRNIIRTLIKALLESNPVEFKQNVLLVCAGMPSGLPPVILSVVEGLSWCTVKKASERKTLVSDEGIAK
jgi:hypothetical protein